MSEPPFRLNPEILEAASRINQSFKDAALEMGRRFRMHREAMAAQRRVQAQMRALAEHLSAQPFMLDAREAMSITVYEGRLAQYRTEARKGVAAVFDQWRRDLGLPDHPFVAPGFPPFPPHAQCFVCGMVQGAHES